MPRVTAPWSTWTTVLAEAAQAASTRPTLPVLSGAKLTTSGEGATITTTDLEVWTVRHFHASGDRKPFLIPVRAVKDLVKAICSSKPAEAAAVPVTVEMDGSTLVVAGFGRTLRVPECSLPLEDFPAVPQMPEAVEVAAVEGEHLQRGIRFVAGAAGHDDTLPMLTGVCFEFSGDNDLVLAATDRYRLATCEPLGVYTRMDQMFLLPARSLKLLDKAVGKLSVKVAEGGEHVAFEHEQGEIILRKLEGSFPSWRSLIPSECAGKWTLVQREILPDIAAAAATADRREPVRVEYLPAVGVQVQGNPVRWTPSDGTVDEKITTAYNPYFVRDAIRGFDSMLVTACLTSGTKPTMFTGWVHGLRNPQHMVMPVRLPG